jgi:monooxygenase
MQTQPMLDLGAGYVQRALDQLPKQGMGDPWRVQMNYYYDVEQLREGSIVDPNLHFASSSQAAAEPQPPVAIGAPQA